MPYWTVKRRHDEPKIYMNDAEGREALWSSLRNRKLSQPEQVFCDSSQYEYHQFTDVVNERRNNLDASDATIPPPPPPVTPQTLDATTPPRPPPPVTPQTLDATTPPPPPPLHSPPPLEPRPASLRRRSSSTSSAEGWPTEQPARADPDHPLIITRSAVYRMKRRAAAVTAVCWMDDFTNNNDDCGEKSGGDNYVDDDDDDGGGDEKPAAGPRSPAVTVDEDAAAEPVTTPRTGSRMTFRSGRNASAGSRDDGQPTGGCDPTTLVTDGHCGGDQRPVTDDRSPAVTDDRDGALGGVSGVRRSLTYSDAAVDRPEVMSDPKPPSKYEMRVKEIDETILFYSKMFLCAFLFFVLCYVWFYSNWFLRAFLFFVLLPHFLTRLGPARAPISSPAPHE